MLFSLSWWIYILLLLVVRVAVGLGVTGFVVVEFLGFAVWVEFSSFPRFSGWRFACCVVGACGFCAGHAGVADLRRLCC